MSACSDLNMGSNKSVKVKMMPKKMDKKKKAEVHEDLEGFDIKIDPFGQMQTNVSIEELNRFLNRNVTDKKLEDRSQEE